MNLTLINGTALDMIDEKRKPEKKKKAAVKPVELSMTTFNPETILAEMQSEKKAVQNTKKKEN